MIFISLKLLNSVGKKDMTVEKTKEFFFHCRSLFYSELFNTTLVCSIQAKPFTNMNKNKGLWDEN